jgi:hypothetical protein
MDYKWVCTKIDHNMVPNVGPRWYVWAVSASCGGDKHGQLTKSLEIFASFRRLCDKQAGVTDIYIPKLLLLLLVDVLDQIQVNYVIKTKF